MNNATPREARPTEVAIAAVNAPESLVETSAPEPITRERVPTEVCENDREFVVRLDIPGALRDSLHVTWERHTLQINGERARPDASEHVLLDERARGPIHRALAMPEGLESRSIRACYLDGVLTIHIPKLTHP